MPICCNRALRWQHTNEANSFVIAASYFFCTGNLKKIRGLTWFWFCSPPLAAPGWEQLAAFGEPHLCRGPVWWRDAPGGGSQMDAPQNPLSDTLQSQKKIDKDFEHFRQTKPHMSEWIKQLRRNCAATWTLQIADLSGSVLTDTHSSRELLASVLKCGSLICLSTTWSPSPWPPESKQALLWRSRKTYLWCAVFANKLWHFVILACGYKSVSASYWYKWLQDTDC